MYGEEKKTICENISKYHTHSFDELRNRIERGNNWKMMTPSRMDTPVHGIKPSPKYRFKVEQMFYKNDKRSKSKYSGGSKRRWTLEGKVREREREKIEGNQEKNYIKTLQRRTANPNKNVVQPY